jgi:phosphosulfolactate synthase
MDGISSRTSTVAYLKDIGTPQLPARTHPFDPGYDPRTVVSHLEQSAHLMASLKISMACWLIAEESASRAKIDAARRQRVPVVTGGGPFEIAVCMGRLDEYLELCAGMGVDRVEAGQGFTDMPLPAAEVVRRACRFGLGVQFELGKKHGGTFAADAVGALLEQGREWLGAGADHLVIEARESAAGVGLFDDQGGLDRAAADRFVKAFGLEVVVFEAPNKTSQFAFLRHLGPMVQVSNVRLEELLRVEIYRRGLHSDAFEEAAFRRNLHAASPPPVPPSPSSTYDGGRDSVVAGSIAAPGAPLSV